MTTYTGNCSDRIEVSAVGVFEGLYQRLQSWFEVQHLKDQVSKERQQLLEMSDAMLSDMGITRTQAKQEAKRLDLPALRLNALDKEVC